MSWAWLYDVEDEEPVNGYLERIDRISHLEWLNPLEYGTKSVKSDPRIRFQLFKAKTPYPRAFHFIGMEIVNAVP